MNLFKPILDTMKDSLKKRREFEKTYRDANRAFLRYIYPDQADLLSENDRSV